MRLLSRHPKVTAGLIWQPEIGPRVKAMAIRTNPKARATPRMPTWPPVMLAVVSPANTSTKVPNNSAAYFIDTILKKNGHSTLNSSQRSADEHSAISTQQSALSTQHSAISTQQSALSTQHSALSNQQSA